MVQVFREKDQIRREWFCLFTSIVSFVTVFAAAYSVYELRNRGFWMEGINNFKAEVEARTYDRWTKTNDAEQDAADWDRFFEANPQLKDFR